MSMNYSDIKKLIAKNAEKTGKHTVGFKIDLDGLNNDLAELKLVAIPYGTIARKLELEDLPVFVEYYREDKLEWLSNNKYTTTLIFVDATKIDDELTEMIAELKKKPQDNPEVDRVAMVSDILADYPCYLAIVVSYQNNSPNSVGKNSYFIACRANKVIIKDPEYVYTPPYHQALKDYESQQEETPTEEPTETETLVEEPVVDEEEV